MPKKHTFKGKAAQVGHLTMKQLLTEVAKALSEPLDSETRKTITLRIATAKQVKKGPRK